MSAKPVTPSDARKNAALARAVVQNETPAIAGQVGLHALALLADMLPTEQFAQFVNDAVHHATTGEIPQDQPQQQQDQTGIPQPAPAQ